MFKCTYKSDAMENKTAMEKKTPMKYVYKLNVFKKDCT